MEHVESARRRDTRARADEDAAPERYPGRGTVRVQRVEIGRHSGGKALTIDRREYGRAGRTAGSVALRRSPCLASAPEG